MHHCTHSFCASRAHLIYGHDGSQRSRLILSRWYIEVTIFGRYANVGWL